jgi:hypothetical protein
MKEIFQSRLHSSLINRTTLCRQNRMPQASRGQMQARERARMYLNSKRAQVSLMKLIHLSG